MSHLFACPSCERHVRCDEVDCPFCGVALGTPPGPRPLPRGHLGRAALLAFGTAIAAASCSEETTNDDDSSSISSAQSSAAATTGGGDGGMGGASSTGSGAGGFAQPYGHAPLPDDLA